MKKVVKRWGNSLVIVFTKEDEESYKLTEGDVIELEDMFIQKKEGSKGS